MIITKKKYVFILKDSIVKNLNEFNHNSIVKVRPFSLAKM